MLTKADLQSIGKVFDNKFKSLRVDIDAIQTRISDLESGKITRLDFYEMKNALYKVEKRMAAYETRLDRIEISIATKDDLKKGLLAMERRLMKSINRLTDSVDNKFMKTEERLDDVERRLSLPKPS